MTNPTFGALGVPAAIVSVLARDDITTAFPIQADTLRDSLAGRDVLGRGRTGSGKTLAFAIPLVVRLGTRPDAGRRRSGRPTGLVLAPTRELANQIEQVLRPLAQVYGLTTTTIFGGVSQHRQVAALRGGVDIVVACPGRLEDLIGQGVAHLDDVRVTVLDEADHMADLGFLPAVTRLLEATPPEGQRMMFSATLDRGIDRLVCRFLHHAVLHSVDEPQAAVTAMTHHVFEVATPEAKTAVLRRLASGSQRRILFTRTKHHAKKLARQLTASGIPAVDLHGNLSQPQRDRHLAAFADGTARVLVATDVAARGVHVDDVGLVVHVDPPVEHKAYLHRSGRTARAGSGGDVVTLSLPAQRRDLAQVLRKAAISVTPVAVTADAPAVTALVGEPAAYVRPAAPAERSAAGSRSGSGGSGRPGRGRSGGTSPSGRPRRGNSRRSEAAGRPAAAHAGGPAAAPAGRAGQRFGRAAQPGRARTAAGRGTDAPRNSSAATFSAASGRSRRTGSGGGRRRAR